MELQAGRKMDDQQIEHLNNTQVEVQQLLVLLEAISIKAKGEPTVSLAEVKRRIAEQKANHEPTHPTPL